MWYFFITFFPAHRAHGRKRVHVDVPALVLFVQNDARLRDSQGQVRAAGAGVAPGELVQVHARSAR